MQTITISLSRNQLAQSLIQAMQLLHKQLGRWLLIACTFLILVESCSLIPYLGFCIKIMLAALLGAQIILLLMAGQSKPTPWQMLRGLFLTLRQQPAACLLLSGCALFCFLCGIGSLAIIDGWQSVAFFFSKPGNQQAPGMTGWTCFKLGTALSGLLFFFLPVNLFLHRLPARQALLASWRGIYLNPALALTMLALLGCIELLNLGLIGLLGKPGIVLVSILALYLLIWTAALRLTSARQIFPGKILITRL